MQGAVASPDMRKIAEAEFFPSNEGSMCAVAMRDASLRRGRGPHHVWKAIVGTEEARPGPLDWSPAGDGGEALPKSPSELRSGVGLAHSTDDAVEGNETRRGKGPA